MSCLDKVSADARDMIVGSIKCQLNTAPAAPPYLSHLVELLVGKRPFGIGRDSRNRGLKEQICSDPVPVSLCLTRAARSLVKVLLKKRPDRRARLKTARRFSFFNANANRPAGQEASWTVQVAEGKQGGISDAMHIHVQDDEILRTTRGCSVLLPAPPKEALGRQGGGWLGGCGTLFLYRGPLGSLFEMAVSAVDRIRKLG